MRNCKMEAIILWSGILSPPCCSVPPPTQVDTVGGSCASNANITCSLLNVLSSNDKISCLLFIIINKDLFGQVFMIHIQLVFINIEPPTCTQIYFIKVKAHWGYFPFFPSVMLYLIFFIFLDFFSSAFKHIHTMLNKIMICKIILWILFETRHRKQKVKWGHQWSVESWRILWKTWHWNRQDQWFGAGDRV